MTIRKNGALVLAYDEGGRALYADIEEREHVPVRYATLPFLTEYAYRDSEGKEVHGDASCFRLAEIKTYGGHTRLRYVTADSAVEVTVIQKLREGVLSQISELKNLRAKRLCVKNLSNVYTGICSDCLKDDYQTRVEVGVVRGEWGGEGQFYWESAPQLGIVRTTGHKTACTAEICSSAAYTTRKVSPVLFFRDKYKKTVWSVQHLPDGPYSLEIGLTDAENIAGSMYFVACGAGDCEKHGFRLYLSKRRAYRCSESLFSCAPDFDSALSVLTHYRRKYLKSRARLPLMFNDYMNCLWCRQDEEGCLSLLDAAQSLGAEGYCFDDGWYRDREANGFTGLGDWIPCDRRFGGRTFAEMVQEIISRNMTAGLWTELEVCSPLSDAANLPLSYFLTNEGERIFRCGRYYFNFANRNVCEYLLERLRALYGLGIRYIKNDYNGHPGCGCDWDGASAYAGLEQHCRCVHAFYARVRKEFPDLILENCASGAMRADARTMRNFHVQSISDCEEYAKMPSIINGTLLCLLPEQLAIWSYPYPRIFWEMNGENYLTPAYQAKMRNGEQTIFNLVNGLMGNMLLSGKIDRADGENLELIARAVALWKTLRKFIAGSVPVYPLGVAHLDDSSVFAAQGLKKGKRILIAVWRREGGDPQIWIPVKGLKRIKEIFPCRNNEVTVQEGGFSVVIPHKDSAVLFEAEICENR